MSWDVLGNDWAVGHLRLQIKNETTHHAYLISGPNGVGKLALATEFARALQCEDADPTNRPCGNCRACKLSQSRTHPDIHLITADEEKTGIDIDQIRSLKTQLALSPFEGRWRIAVLPSFHAASRGSANAILKTLEEPSPRVVLILTADSIELVLPTIASRCEVLQLRPMAIPELKAALEARDVPEQEAARLAAYSAGLPARALDWQNQPETLEARLEFIEDLDQLLIQNRVERFAYVQQITPRKAPLRTRRLNCITALDAWMGYWRDLLLLTSGIDERAVYEDRGQELKILAATLSTRQAHQALSDIQHTQDALAANADPTLAMEALMLQLPRLQKT